MFDSVKPDKNLRTQLSTELSKNNVARYAIPNKDQAIKGASQQEKDTFIEMLLVTVYRNSQRAHHVQQNYQISKCFG